MITAYLAGIASQYEGEDIEVRYSIYNDQELLVRKALLLDYQKPAIVGLVALLALFKELKKYKERKIVIIINDAALYEIARGTSTTKNSDVLQTARKTREEFKHLEDCVLKDVSGDHAELEKWFKEIHQGEIKHERQ